jgi:hypothetical protein
MIRVVGTGAGNPERLPEFMLDTKTQGGMAI